MPMGEQEREMTARDTRSKEQGKRVNQAQKLESKLKWVGAALAISAALTNHVLCAMAILFTLYDLVREGHF